MADDWTHDELRDATRAYLWMLRSAQNGMMPNKTAVRKALLAGPLSARNESSVEFRFQNISAVLANNGREWLKGYRPAKQVGANVEPKILKLIEDYESGPKELKKVSFLVSALSPATVSKAATALTNGETFEYADSTTYDAVTRGGSTLAPKAVIGYAGLLQYGAPLISEDFAGGEGTPCFERLRASGLGIKEKVLDPQSEEFRKEVRTKKKKGFSAPPTGKNNPKKVVTTTTTFVRDPDVVAYVELRAKGRCERCDNPAPFLRKDETPYLEVHHIDPLSEDGADTVDNAVALCPNCHRECHYGCSATEIRTTLLAKVNVIMASK